MAQSSPGPEPPPSNSRRTHRHGGAQKHQHDVIEVLVVLLSMIPPDSCVLNLKGGCVDLGIKVQRSRARSRAREAAPAKLAKALYVYAKVRQRPRVSNSTASPMEF